MTEDPLDDQEALIKTSVSLPLYLYEWMRDVSKRDSTRKRMFNSQSAVMVTALAELKGRMEIKGDKEEASGSKKEECTDIELLLNAYFETFQGKEHLKKIITKNITLEKQKDAAGKNKNSYLDYVE